jgi:hypothetical protein
MSVDSAETIEKSGVVEKTGNKAHFEIFAEDFEPVLDDLTAQFREVD